MKFIYLTLLLIFLGIIFIVTSSINSHYIKESSLIELKPGEGYNVSYLSDSQVIFSYNYTSPIKVIGYPSSATTSNDSYLYVVCFFAQQAGEIEITQQTLIYYTLYESTGLALYSEYLTVIGIILIGSGITYFAYKKWWNSS